MAEGKENVSQVADPACEVGQRVQADDGALATVRYVGPVEGTKGEWIGVEWDNPARGKHDGSHKGVHYFDCAGVGGETAASFVRVHKIVTGVTFMQALEAKYRGATQSGDAKAAMSVESASGHRVDVQLVVRDSMLEAQSTVSRLAEVFLPDSCIVSAGPEGEIAAAASQVSELDLSGNLLKDWNAVERFGQELLQLRVLHLCRLRIPWPSTSIDVADSSFAHLKTLVLNKADITWQQAVALSRAVPALEELHLCDNGISTLAPAVPGSEGGAAAVPLAEAFRHLRVLNLDSNTLEQWSEVQHLQELPALQRLLLNQNRLTAISYADATPEATPGFAQLHTLLLGGNRIADWSSIDALHRFPSVTEIRVTDNPLPAPAKTAGGPAMVRLECVARIGDLAALNGSRVTPPERKDAEIRYLRRVITEARQVAAEASTNPSTAAPAEGEPEQLPVDQKLHPRYEQLVSAYGQLASGWSGADADGQSGGMSQDMITVCLKPVFAAGWDKEPQVKKLPGSLTVGKLKLLLERLFKLPVVSQSLFVQPAGAPVPEPLAEDGESLAYLGLTDGAVVLIDELEA